MRKHRPVKGSGYLFIFTSKIYCMEEPLYFVDYVRKESNIGKSPEKGFGDKRMADGAYIS